MAIDDCSSLFATIRRFLPLFATIRTIRDYSHYSGLFAVRYSRLFAIRYSGFPDTRQIVKLTNDTVEVKGLREKVLLKQT